MASTLLSLLLRLAPAATVAYLFSIHIFGAGVEALLGTAATYALASRVLRSSSRTVIQQLKSPSAHLFGPAISC